MSFAPVSTPETQPYWEGAEAGKLVIPRCAACGAHYFPPAPVCPKCTSRNIDWVTASGRATLYSFMVTYNPWPQWNVEGPMSVALVALEEGPRLISTVVDCEQSPEAFAIDMPLEATWRRFGESGPRMLCFRPVAERGYA